MLAPAHARAGEPGQGAFANKLLEEAEHDLARIGLVLDTLKIQNVTDDVTT